MIGPYYAAALQFNPRLRQITENRQCLYARVEEAAKSGVKLIVTPEMAISGYHFRDREAIAPFTETVPGVTTDIFTELARKYDCYIVLGMPEVDRTTGLYYNSAVLVGPEGVVGTYRKMHLWDTEARWAVWGNQGMPVFATKIGRIAMIICMDAYFFESFRLAALQNANVVAFLTNSSGGAVANLQARAVENGLYVVSANRSDRELAYTMKGASAIWHPSGRLLAEAEGTGEETVRVVIDDQEFQNRGKRLLAQRRPELYHDLALHSTPWDSGKTEASTHVEIACCQYRPIPDDKTANRLKVRGLLEQAWQQMKSQRRELDLVVLPELSFCGAPSCLNKEGAGELAESLGPVGQPGSSLAFVADLAQSLHTNMVFGLIENEADKFYNTAVLVGRDGKVLRKYRKTHLNEEDRVWATPGDRIEVVRVEGVGRVGLSIGSEVQFPEICALLAIHRADLIVMPSAWRAEEGGRVLVSQAIHPDAGMVPVYWDVRARDNCAYLAAANYVDPGAGYQGNSGVYAIDPLYGLDRSCFLGSVEEAVSVTGIVTKPENWYTQDRFLGCRRLDEAYYPLLSGKQRESNQRESNQRREGG